MSRREPLQAVSLNHETTSLYPIFLRKRSPAADADLDTDRKRSRHPSHTDTRKRARLSASESETTTRLDDWYIPDYFDAVVPRRPSVKATKTVYDEIIAEPSTWRRPRARLGLAVRPRQYKEELSTAYLRPITIPSLDTSRALPYDPALTIAFNNRARLYSADDARQLGERRLIALAGEEGTVNIVDIDDEQDPGTWWKAHGNGVFDLEWTTNDTRLLSASADQTLRLHDVAAGQLVATLRGHTSTIKTVAFFDPSRSAGNSGDVVASGGRDGDIHIYDLRCQGQPEPDTSLRRSSRTRPLSTIASELNPVLVLKQPHNDASNRYWAKRSSSRSITSLIALQSMPGILASGGSFDGVVKLWDIRCPEPTSNFRPKYSAFGALPDPTTFSSTRARSVNALCEQPLNGDIYALCGDSNVHVLRPAAAKQADCDPRQAILPQTFTHPDPLINFYIRMSLSPDCKYLACGSSSGGVMTWDTRSAQAAATPVRVQVPNDPNQPEFVAVDWAKDMVAASADDCRSHLWRVSDIVKRQ